MPPHEGTLPEYEIHTRLVKAMRELPQNFPILKAIAKIDRKIPSLRLFSLAMALTFKLNPKWAKYAVVLLRETLGKALPNGAEAAAMLWFSAHMFAKKFPKEVNRAGIPR